jgi:hypothetical protein
MSRHSFRYCAIAADEIPFVLNATLSNNPVPSSASFIDLPFAHKITSFLFFPNFALEITSFFRTEKSADTFSRRYFVREKISEKLLCLTAFNHCVVLAYIPLIL